MFNRSYLESVTDAKYIVQVGGRHPDAVESQNGGESDPFDTVDQAIAFATDVTVKGQSIHALAAAGRIGLDTYGDGTPATTPDETVRWANIVLAFPRETPGDGYDLGDAETLYDETAA